MNDTYQIAIIGAGPAGLTAGYQLSKDNYKLIILEADKKYVGGISKTIKYKGYYCDIGGHRFFTKSDEVNELWDEILPNDLLERKRSSKIYFRKKLFIYPLNIFDSLSKLGIIEAFICIFSYIRYFIFPVKPVDSFEDWIINRFGKRLYNNFFKTYTEKIWGISCTELSADWAAQRIKSLSLTTAVINAILPKFYKASKDNTIKTMINSFKYPRKGPGMMWEECTNKIINLGGIIKMGSKVNTCTYDFKTKLWNVHYYNGNTNYQIKAQHIISSAPLGELIKSIKPVMPQLVLKSAESLNYRDFFVVMIILKETNGFDDNWIYIHEPGVKVGRIQNFKAWSPEMVPDPKMNCYGMEYFCFEDDNLWKTTDNELIELASKELISLGLAKHNDIIDANVVRQKKAYPVYNENYSKHVNIIRNEIDTNYPNLHIVGRNGMHKYNNQDHAMLTAILTAKNIHSNKHIYDIWKVNEDAQYIEEDESNINDYINSINLPDKGLL